MSNCYIFLVFFVFSFIAVADWPQFLGPDRTGQVMDSSLTDDLVTRAPKELWTVSVGEGFGGAAISKGDVFILDRENDENDIIRCIELKSGNKKWSRRYKNEGRFSHNGSRSIPAVDDKYVFTIGCMGDVVCANRKDGVIIWKKNLRTDWGSSPESWGYGQSPVLYKDMIIFAPLSKSAGVVALEKSTGKQLWKTKDVGKKDGYASPIITKLLGQEMLVQQSSDAVVGLNPSTGKLLWSYGKYHVRWAIPAPVNVGGDRLFLSGGYGAGSAMIQLSKKGSKIVIAEVFRMNKKGSQIHAPLFYKGHLYANFNENDNLKKRSTKQGLTCIDLKGNIKWNTADKPNLNRGNVIMVNNYLIALDGDTGELIYSIANSVRYREISRHKVLIGKGKKIWSPMALVGGFLVLRDQNELKCLKIY